MKKDNKKTRTTCHFLENETRKNAKRQAFADMVACGISVRVFAFEEALCGHKVDGRSIRDLSAKIEISIEL